MIGRTEIAAVIGATWPPAQVDTVGPFDLCTGAGGGNRVSAARLAEVASGGEGVSKVHIAETAEAQAALGQEALFIVFGWQEALDRALEQEGFVKRDETLVLAAPVPEIAALPPPVSCFDIWPPLAVQEEIWAEGGIGPARLAIMHRAQGPKTSLLGRVADRPAGTAFIALNGSIAMLHALEVAPRARRQGLARLMVRAGAAWAEDQGGALFTVLVTRENTAARELYASLGLKAVENYHYRVK